ncbi:uncharacterized protein [Prorops nasuta]|uniref:uncharacterized protein n=1 Tax=Prorops nasuta TaxID=863751 RepID=UPI0034CFE4D2
MSDKYKTDEQIRLQHYMGFKRCLIETGTFALFALPVVSTLRLLPGPPRSWPNLFARIVIGSIPFHGVRMITEEKLPLNNMLSQHLSYLAGARTMVALGFHYTEFVWFYPFFLYGYPLIRDLAIFNGMQSIAGKNPSIRETHDLLNFRTQEDTKSRYWFVGSNSN